jgi:protein-tyrosine phosphatase
MAAALLAARLPGFEVTSGGRLDGGVPVSAAVLEVMDQRGLDLRDHRSRRTTVDELAAADLVVGMAREHVRDAALALPEILERAFTLKALVREGEAMPRPLPGSELASWAAVVARTRPRTALLGASKDDDVADPMGRSRRAHRRCAAELDDLTRRLAALLAPFAEPAR